MKKREIVELLQRGVDPVRLNDKEQACGIYDGPRLKGYRVWERAGDELRVVREVRL